MTFQSGDSNFDGNYMDYWKDRVASSRDGSKVADAAVIDGYLACLGIKSSDVVIDVGCGFGRLFGLLNRYSQRIVGIDVCQEILETAANAGYTCLVEGRAEDTHLASVSVDKIVMWASFDVVEQEQTLVELNRILRPGGRLLLTGKNLSYRDDDELAFIAERNAKLKNFPNHFTDIAKLQQQCGQFGFAICLLKAFERRGDFGENRSIDLLSQALERFYEFVAILEKKADAYQVASHSVICDEFSNVARERARREGFDNRVTSYFRHHCASESSRSQGDSAGAAAEKP
jgi:ubiquinone/menaquinone biosynthesis C-methylase UbiE